ncbi:MAG: 3-phosphoshikimate 1-carboxyvinyltransferase [Muribaculaceae bacterium]|nr:3-phosphoshikimate 1-carboxyvinyltransferase [Muribaculaceae bacterium]
MRIAIFPPEEMLEAAVQLPLSKSMSVRAIAMAAMGATYNGPLAECADTEAMRRVAGCRSGEADAGESGAALRFGTAILAATPGAEVTLTGSPRLLSRPMQPLLDMLRSLGADVEADAQGRITVHGRSLQGGRLEVEATVSSQFISALLMAAPAMAEGLHLTIDWNQPSLPYIDLTLAMMRARGIDCGRDGIEITVRPGCYSAPAEPDVEPDWSAAVFWYEIAALTAGFVDLPGLPLPSKQADSAAAEVFSRLGVCTTTDEEGVHLCADPEMHARLDLDCSAMPDMVPALAATCAMLGVPFEFEGCATLKAKECDRVDAIISELARTGAVAEYYRGTLSWDGRRVPVTEMPVFDVRGDHRMAMALAPVSVFAPGIVIEGAECVAKSYPEFWTHLQGAGFMLADPDQAVEREAEE